MYEQIEQFYKDNYNVLVKRLNRRAGGVENAEDVLQEAFLRALKYHSSFNPERQEMGAWFNTIMNNVLVQFQREQMLGGATIPYDEYEHEETYECMSENNKFISQIAKIIQSKSERPRSILHLYYLRGYKAKEIQQIVGGGYVGITLCIKRFKSEMIEEFGDDFESW